MVSDRTTPGDRPLWPCLWPPCAAVGHAGVRAGPCLSCSAEWHHAWCWAAGLLGSCCVQAPGGLCPSCLFQSSLFLSHLSLSSFCVLSKLGACPAILSTQPQPPLPCRRCMAGCPRCAPFLLATWHLWHLLGLSVSETRAVLTLWHTLGHALTRLLFLSSPKWDACFQSSSLLPRRGPWERASLPDLDPHHRCRAQPRSLLACTPLLPSLFYHLFCSARVLAAELPLYSWGTGV